MTQTNETGTYLILLIAGVDNQTKQATHSSNGGSKHSNFYNYGDNNNRHYSTYVNKRLYSHPDIVTDRY